MNRINIRLQDDKKILSIYFTAGYPKLQDTVPTIEALARSGVDMIEIGLPFSDPLADGPVIQQSSATALQNDMTTKLLFEQLKDIRKTVEIPLLIMAYYNPILQFGMEEFCQKCFQTGIDGLIIPDLPLEIYQRDYKGIFEKYNLKNISLITPQTQEERIRKIDQLSDSFIYMVSSSSTTGTNTSFGETQKMYFEKIAEMELQNPQIIGFGISNKEQLSTAFRLQKGAIIGSDFIKFISENSTKDIGKYVNSFL